MLIVGGITTNTIRPHSSLGYRPPAPETASCQTLRGQRCAVDGRRLAHQLNRAKLGDKRWTTNRGQAS